LRTSSIEKSSDLRTVTSAFEVMNAAASQISSRPDPASKDAE
jgi:hypothetical protein